ncbi:hypothetical protein EV210_10442 [Anaerospora hongkongensis]|uniref:Uncharacterized protein n=1 Tax=Anaerospora hongkongensis TaxID=244830 RepID=A0A4R1Q1B3_9FIRM|nr:hypothetical protein EV210_10442 [Anaerospora hongkongensis]
MRFPNKVISYKESTIGKLDIILEITIKRDISPFELYEKTKANFEDIGDYIETLVCLYALKRISFNSKTGRITYVI